MKLFPMRCFYLPWHHQAFTVRLTEQTDKYVCSCGRAFGVNHSIGAVLPWDAVKELYEGPRSILRFM